MNGIPPPRAALPETVLQRDDVRDALAHQDFGQLFVLARKWGGVSFSAIAECCDIKPERVGTLARGHGAITSHTKMLQIADGLRIPGHLLGLLPRPWEPSHPSSPSTTPPARSREPGRDVSESYTASSTVPGSVSQGLMMLTWDDLAGGESGNAREIIGGTELLDSWHTPRAEVHTPYVRPGRIGLREIQELERSANEFRLWDHQLGGGIRRKAVVGQLNELAEFLKLENSQPVQRRLLGVIALMAMVAAHMSSDVGHSALAQRYLVLGLQATQESGDLRLGARVSNTLGRNLLERHRPTTALDWIHHAQNVFSAGVDAEHRALLSATEARIHSSRNDIDSVERCLKRADDQLTHARDATLFGQAELSGVTGACFETLMVGDHDQSERYAQRARQNTLAALGQRADSYARSRTLDLIGLANVELLTSGIDQAMSSANLAVRSAAKLRSHRVAQRLHQFATRAFELHPDEEKMWEFAELIQVRFPQTGGGSPPHRR